MQVFIVGTPFETARVLDKRRLNKQIVECQQILDAINGAKAWSNHPCTLQYKDHSEWLYAYMMCLIHYREDTEYGKEKFNEIALEYTPPFHTEEYFNQMKRRLYSKDKEYYEQWAYLGESEDNWYFVDGEWRIYNNGKRIK
jgi:hypothetical protein